MPKACFSHIATLVPFNNLFHLKILSEDLPSTEVKNGFKVQFFTINAGEYAFADAQKSLEFFVVANPANNLLVEGFNDKFILKDWLKSAYDKKSSVEIGVKILSHFDKLKNCDWSGHILRRGNILSATCQISRATINFQGSDTTFDLD
ncbi:hypothetical protein Fot_30124 [Forsythia ovata]|uniref:Uncharacterized protein n=1 Tax=Forsythia ovata TaxID=205694 RepID=A0ABD1TUD9_9LAMI